MSDLKKCHFIISAVLRRLQLFRVFHLWVLLSPQTEVSAENASVFVTSPPTRPRQVSASKYLFLISTLIFRSDFFFLRKSEFTQKYNLLTAQSASFHTHFMSHCSSIQFCIHFLQWWCTRFPPRGVVGTLAYILCAFVTVITTTSCADNKSHSKLKTIQWFFL